ncbi:hypothetical protein [Bdellovibrio sp. HCB337]|uniref:hypothetical protein n=1 Tax=Bdellovibrio sp. HCB337 TaxID=3394358 RepID=UPI0039A52F9C
MNPKQLFAIGGFLTLGLLSFWVWRTSAPEDSVGEEASVSQQETTQVQKAPADQTPTTTSQSEVSAPPQVTATDQKPSTAINTVTEEKQTWAKPEKPTYWDQVPEQKKAIDFFTKLGDMKFPAGEKPIYVGINDQGFDQYQYKSSNGADVTQWKRSNEVVIEEAILPNGDKITRKGVEADNPVSSVSYESKANKTYQRTTYKANGSIDSLRIDENGHTTIYYYDEQGRVRETYSGPTPK